VSKVVFLKVPHERQGVQNAVRKAMELLDWGKYIKGRQVFVKVNLISSEFVPGQCTSPLILDEVLRELTERDFKVVFGDADLAAARQCNRAASVWGHKRLAEHYGVRFQNLSEDRLIEVNVQGKVFKKLHVPQSILEADSIISLPVMKTHCLTGITCALKHFWGVVPRVRHQYHLVVNEAIADINQFLNPKVAFALVDGTIAMEENAPRTGIPKVCDVIMGSNDLVAIDLAASRYMGMPLPEHIVVASKRGLGSLEYELIGDNFEPCSFVPPNPNAQPIFKWEMFFRRSFIKPLLFDTKIFDILSFIATKYNTVWYYQLKGKKYAREITSTWYGEELKEFIPSLGETG
jgi:uncharacterized protein (DUF362 family)